MESMATAVHSIVLISLSPPSHTLHPSHRHLTPSLQSPSSHSFTSLPHFPPSLPLSHTPSLLPPSLPPISFVSLLYLPPSLPPLPPSLQEIPASFTPSFDLRWCSTNWPTSPRTHTCSCLPVPRPPCHCLIPSPLQ